MKSKSLGDEMEDHMAKVYAFQAALRTLETLVTWFLIIIPAASAALFTVFALLEEDFDVAAASLLGTIVYIVVAHFAKTLALGTAYTLVAIAENTSDASAL